jgi:hypothetical protein
VTSPEKLQRENTVVLYAVQALLGLIARNVIAVAVQVTDARITLRFWVHDPDATTEEDVRDACFELESLFANENPQIDSEIHLGPPPTNWSQWAGRMIYWSKE